MNKKLFSFSLMSIFVVTLISFLNQKSINAQTPSFNADKCVKNFVSQGLTKDNATVWCNAKKNCLIASADKKLPPEVAESVCKCSVNEFKKRYSVDKFREVSKKSKEELVEIGEACFEEILFEE